MTSRPAAPESETPEPIARWSGGICKTCGNYTHSCKCNHPKSPILDELFSTKTAPTPCPTCGGLREQHLERQLSLAQTEIKGHMRVQDELREAAEAELDLRMQVERDLAQAQARIAELEKALVNSADSFKDVAHCLRMIGHPISASACEMAEEGARDALKSHA